MKRLENKVAVVYGDGSVGAAIAKAFAREGAKVFLTGRTSAKLKATEDEITADGGEVETAVVDALSESAVEKHMSELIKKVGKIDISFNAIGLRQKDIQSTPLMELSLEDFSLPITTYSQSHFLTSRAAAQIGRAHV